MHKLIITLGVAGVLAGCSSLSDHPEFHGLTQIADIPNGEVRVKTELDRVRGMGNTYLAQAKNLEQESRFAGAGVLGFGIYSAGVVAFNPAPKNLLAGLLGAGIFQAWRTSLKPGERAKVYVRGYRALDCLQGAGTAMLNTTETAEKAAELRGDVVRGLTAVARVRGNVTSETPNRAELLTRLAVTEKALAELDVALKLEQDSVVDAPNRISAVRRQIETTVDKQLDGMAPDYAGALKLLSEAAKPPSSGAGASPSAGTNKGANNLVALVGATPSLEDQVSDIEEEVGRIKSKAPTQASIAYASMARCVEAA